MTPHTHTHAPTRTPGVSSGFQGLSRSWRRGPSVHCPVSTHTLRPMQSHQTTQGSAQALRTYPGRRQTSSAPQSGCLGRRPGCGSPVSNLGRADDRELHVRLWSPPPSCKGDPGELEGGHHSPALLVGEGLPAALRPRRQGPRPLRSTLCHQRADPHPGLFPTEAVGDLPSPFRGTPQATGALSLLESDTCHRGDPEQVAGGLGPQFPHLDTEKRTPTLDMSEDSAQHRACPQGHRH